MRLARRKPGEGASWRARRPGEDEVQYGVALRDLLINATTCTFVPSDISRAKGFEIGAELGFYEACCRVWLSKVHSPADSSSDQVRMERCVGTSVGGNRLWMYLCLAPHICIKATARDRMIN